MKVLFNWIVFIGILAGLYFAIQFALPYMTSCFIAFRASLPQLPGAVVLFFSLSLAFYWVEIRKKSKVKPFNCLKCMTGWISLIMAFMFHVPFCLLYLFAGLFVGSLFDRAAMRYL